MFVRSAPPLTFSWQVMSAQLSVLVAALIFFYFFPMLKVVGKEDDLTTSEL
jgi:aspartokinase-like uncharacterized kinase